MRYDDEVQGAARNLFEGAVPERKDDLTEFWTKYRPRFSILEDVGPEGRFVLDSGAYRDVRFNHRAMRAFWLGSFIAWEGYRAVAEGVVAGSFDLSRFCEMAECFERMLTEEDSAANPLPDGIPEPGTYLDASQYPQLRTASELATIAAGWALLHEVCHLRHQQEGTGAALADPPERWREEELSCDNFATKFLLDKISEYAAAESVSGEQVRLKREIGIYFAMFVMTLISAGRWDETSTHPAMERRISEVMRQMGANGARPADAIAHMAFVALWSVRPDAPGPFKRQGFG